MGLIQSNLLSSVNGIVHGFSDKTLGGDAGRIANELGLSGVNLLKQVHGDRVLIVSEMTSGRERGEADAQVTELPGIGIGIATADCVPILLASEDAQVVAAVHAGWRGTLAEISAKTVRVIKETYGIEPGSLKAAIGPSIGRCCYEVGAEVGSEFRDKYSDTAEYLFAAENGKYMLDLSLANEILLRSEGVTEVEALELCTKCSPEFYSYRGDGKGTGRQLSVIGISR